MIISAAIWTVPSSPRPDVRLTADDLEIEKSCTITIPPATVIEDRNGNGVIQIAASDIVVQFADGSVLHGSPASRRPDEYRGYGIRLNGHSNVTIRDARIRGFWGALWASNASGLRRCRGCLGQSTGAPEVDSGGRGWRRLALPP
jgi:hypothetical protein